MPKFVSPTILTGATSLTALSSNTLSFGGKSTEAVVLGYQALLNTTSPKVGVVAIGTGVLSTNNLNAAIVGDLIGIGTNALQAATTGASRSIAIGTGALGKAAANGNVAVGHNAGANSTNGDNVFVGYLAGQTMTTGNLNVVIGSSAALSAVGVGGATAIGGQAVSGQNGVAVGSQTSATASGAVANGCDSSGTGATTSTANDFMLGTANHNVKILGTLVVSKTLDATVGFRHGNSTLPSWQKGTGTPEGVVTAPIGSIFSRTDGTTNTALYRKESGVGNTGWIAVSNAGAGAVSSVDGRTGAVVLSDLYLDVAGDTMTGNLNFNQKEAQNLVTHKLAAAPSSPVEGQRYYDTVAKVEKIYTGGSWITLADIVYVNTAAPTDPTNTGDLWFDTDEPATLMLPLGVSDGGTGGTSPTMARTNLAVPYIGNSTTVTGPPTSGAYVRGDQWLDSAATLWFCTTAGSPGGWTLVPGGGNSTTTAGAPTSGTWVRGDQWIDVNNVLWLCTTAGTPGTWTSTNRGEELAYNQTTANMNITATSAATANQIVAGTARTYDGNPIWCTLNAPSVFVPASSFVVLTLMDGATEICWLGSAQAPAGGLYFTAAPARKLTPSVGTHTYSASAWISGTGTGILQAGTGAPGSYGPAFLKVTRA
jgi:hypothetical protein